MMVQRIDDFETLAALAPDWHRLWQRSSGTPFQHPSFVLGWWSAFHPGQIAAAAFFEGGQLAALAPFYREAETRRLLIMGMGLGDYLDVIADSEPATKAALDTFIARAEAPVSLENLPPGSPLRTERWQRHCVCPISNLSVPLPPRMRRSLALSRNRIARRGDWNVTTVAPPIPLDMLARFGALHRARQNSLGHRSIFDDQRAVALIGALAAEPSFPLQVHEARIAGHAAAGAITLHGPAGIYFWLLAMAPEFAFESLAKQLLAELRAGAIADGLDRIYWLRGDEPYKALWGAEPEWSYALFRPDGLRESA